MKIQENVKLDFTVPFEIYESDEQKSQWLKLGGVALEEGISANKRKYTFKNIEENNEKNFKWLFGHHREFVEEHVVGKGFLKEENGKLRHEGKIRNTSRHPDVVEMVKDGLLSPSIHATAKKIQWQGEECVVEGLDIKGVSLVAFNGVKNASIDYAIAESIDLFESEHKSDDEIKKDNEVDKMEEDKKPVEPVVEQPKEDPKVEQPKEPSAEESELVKLREELATFKQAQRNDIVESILKVNGELNKDELVKESVDKLKLILEYEQKLAQKTSSVGVVEESNDKPIEENEFSFEIVEQDGSFGLTKESYAQFNKEIREKLR